VRQACFRWRENATSSTPYSRTSQQEKPDYAADRDGPLAKQRPAVVVPLGGEPHLIDEVGETGRLYHPFGNSQ